MVTDSKTHTFTTLSNKFKLIILYVSLYVRKYLFWLSEKIEHANSKSTYSVQN